METREDVVCDEVQPQFVLRYGFDDAARDSSGNGYHGQLQNVQIVAGDGNPKGVAPLSAEAHIKTPLHGIFNPYTLALWVKPSGAQADGAVCESDEARIFFRNNTIQFEQDGTE